MNDLTTSPPETKHWNGQRLLWPTERANASNDPESVWFNSHSNYCLDFHGDPASADLTVYSDGNHHMALEQALDTFRERNRLTGIFYCTTPPKVYLDLMQQGYVDLGNLRISNRPDIVIGPDDIIGKLHKSGQTASNQPFMQSRGNSLLVRKGNPTNISSVEDLFAPTCNLFISNPRTEGASHVVYRQTLENQARALDLSESLIANRFDENNETLVYGENIHHREAPTAVASGAADVAMVYHIWPYAIPAYFRTRLNWSTSRLKPATLQQPITAEFATKKVRWQPSWRHSC